MEDYEGPREMSLSGPWPRKEKLRVWLGLLCLGASLSRGAWHPGVSSICGLTLSSRRRFLSFAVKAKVRLGPFDSSGG